MERVNSYMHGNKSPLFNESKFTFILNLLLYFIFHKPIEFQRLYKNLTNLK